MKYNLVSEKVRAYFDNGPRRIIKVTANDDYTLTLVFDNDEIRIYNMSNNLFGVFEVLKNIDKFKEVFIDESGNIAWDKDKNIDSNVIWNNRIDICKDSVYMDSIKDRQ